VTSQLIKGGWQLAGGHGAVYETAAIADMFAYAEAGITAFDCADIYTGVEALIGRFLVEWRARHGVSAPPIRVHTKCVPDLDLLPNLTRADIERTIDRSLRRLGVERLDLVQFHWWDYALGDWFAALSALANEQGRGAVRHLGVTNFGTPHLRRMLDAGMPVVSHQLQFSILDRRPAREMAALCAQHGVGLLCYGALAGGFMHRRWLGAPEPQDTITGRRPDVISKARVEAWAAEDARPSGGALASTMTVVRRAASRANPMARPVTAIGLTPDCASA